MEDVYWSYNLVDKQPNKLSKTLYFLKIFATKFRLLLHTPLQWQCTLRDSTWPKKFQNLLQMHMTTIIFATCHQRNWDHLCPKLYCWLFSWLHRKEHLILPTECPRNFEIFCETLTFFNFIFQIARGQNDFMYCLVHWLSWVWNIRIISIFNLHSEFDAKIIKLKWLCYLSKICSFNIAWGNYYVVYTCIFWL